MELAVKENKVEFSQQFKYIKTFKNIENGDKLLLSCLKRQSCNLDNYSDLMNKSPLHVQIAIKYPNFIQTPNKPSQNPQARSSSATLPNSSASQTKAHLYLIH